MPPEPALPKPSAPPPQPDGGREVSPCLLAMLTFGWFLVVAFAHYRDFFTHK